MKCREMNPGNVAASEAEKTLEQPSMKCREMNPGNPLVQFLVASSSHPQ